MLAYFGLTYLLSWGIWIPLIVTGNSNQWLLWIAGFGPTLSALLMMGIQDRWTELRQMFKQRKRVKPYWYIFSIMGTPLVMLVALGLHILFGGALPRFNDPNHLITSLDQWPMIFVVILYIFFFTALGEEIGWRGYALPRLQAQFSSFTSSIILGIIWACWHLPLFWLAGDFHQQLPLTWFLLQILGSTFIYTWLFNRTGGNLWIALWFHTSSNAAVGLLPILPLDNGGSMIPLWFTVGILWLIASLLLWLERKRFFLAVK